MKVAVLLLSLAAACPCGAWPADFAYRGKVRPESWWDKAFLYFRPRMRKANNVYVDTGAVDKFHCELPVGVAGKVSCLILKIDDGTKCYARLLQHSKDLPYQHSATPQESMSAAQIIYVELRALPKAGLRFIATVAAVDWHTSKTGKRYVHCLEYKHTDEPLSREDFTEAVMGGFQLAKWEWSKPEGENGKRKGRSTMAWRRKFVQ